MFNNHIFVCSTGKTCSEQGGQEVRDELKRLMKAEGLGLQMRINNCGCLGQCGFGPNIVIYPQQIWYQNVTIDDVPEIWESIKNGTVVERLLNPRHHQTEQNAD